MPYVKMYKLENGKRVYTNSLEAFIGTIFDGRVVTEEPEEKPKK